MSGIKKLAGETVIYGTSSILGRLLNFVVLTPYLTRVFTNQEYGQFSDLYAWAALLMVIFTYRLETTFFRYGRKKDDRNITFSTASLSILISTLLFCLVLLGFSKSIADGLQYQNHPEYIQYFILIIAFDALAAIPFARLRLENRPYLFAALKILGIVVNVLFIFFFLEVLPWFQPYYDDNKRLSYVFLSNLLASGAVLLFLLPAYRYVRLQFDQSLWRKMIRYAGPLILAGIAGVVNQLIGIPLLRQIASPNLQYNEELAGIYGGVAKLAVLINLFTQAFNYAAEPFFFRHADKANSKMVYGQIGQAFSLVGALAFLTIMLYLDVIKYLIDPEMHEGLGIVPLLLLAYICLGLFYNFSIWYKLADRTVMGGYIALGGSAITIALNLILIPRVGYYGPAIAALSCYAFMAYSSYKTGQKYAPIPYPITRMGLYFLVAGSGYFLADTGRAIWGNQPLVILGVNTLILVGCIWLFYRLERHLFQQFLSMTPFRNWIKKSKK